MKTNKVTLKIVNILLSMVMILSMGAGVFADEEVLPLETTMNSFERQGVIERFTREFEGDTDKINTFLAMLAEKEAEYAELDDIAFYKEVIKKFAELKFGNTGSGVPIKDRLPDSLEHPDSVGISTLTPNESPKDGVSILSSPQADTIAITSTVFSGFSGTNQIFSIQPGFMRVKLDIVNGYNTQMPIIAKVKLQNRLTRDTREVAVVERDVAAMTGATVVVGFNAPLDYPDYNIKIELWDDSGNWIIDEETFPDPPLPTVETWNYFYYFWEGFYLGPFTIYSDGDFEILRVSANPDIEGTIWGGVPEVGTYPSGTTFHLSSTNFLEVGTLLLEIRGVNTYSVPEEAEKYRYQ